MIVSPRLQRRSVEQDDAPARGDLPDARQRNFSEFRRDARASWDREQEFVLLPSMDGLIRCSAGKTRRRNNLGVHSGCEAEAFKVQ